MKYPKNDEHLALVASEDFRVLFSAEGNLQRFLDERSDPAMADVVRDAIVDELHRRAHENEAPTPAPEAPAPKAPNAPAESDGDDE